MIKKQILLDLGYNNNLEGKVIDKVSFVTNEQNYDENQLLITFKDDSYIMVCIGLSDGEPVFENGYAMDLNHYGIIPHYINSEGKVCFEPYIKYQIEQGVVEPMTEEELDALLSEKKRQFYDQRYKQYLELKKEFEGL